MGNIKKNLIILVLLLNIILFLSCEVNGNPLPKPNEGQVKPEEVADMMKNIPQNHCLRYRKFDMLKRCRNYRVTWRHRFRDNFFSIHKPFKLPVPTQ